MFRFLQNYPHFLERVYDGMERVCDMGRHEKAFVLVGVGPLRSERAAEFMHSKAPGVVIPDAVVERLRKTPKKQKRAEGKRICVEIIQQIDCFEKTVL